ncbi:hypothetical protein [Shewanella sp. 125m-1]
MNVQMRVAARNGNVFFTAMNTSDSLVYIGDSPAHIFAYLNEFEPKVITDVYGINAYPAQVDAQFRPQITQKQVLATSRILESIFRDKKRFADFQGFYDIEDDLKNVGVDRYDAILILTYLKANRQFVPLIEKMDSTSSPIECKTFDLPPHIQ